MDAETTTHNEWLRRQVSRAASIGDRSLPDFVQCCRGADPIAVRDTVEACGFSAALARVNPDSDSSTLSAPVHPGIPPPHPLDFEWRFSIGGAETLLRHAREQHDADLLLLGCTTVGVLAGDGRWTGSVHAVDRSSLTTNLIESLGLPVRITRRDLTVSSTEPDIADIVLLDPPWYVPQAEAFIRSAARSCRVGGRVLAVLPGTGTRPSADRDCEHLTRYSASHGLALKRLHEDEIIYETPYFEHNAIRAANIGDDMLGWRRGDLYDFERVETPEPALGMPPSGPEPWDELRSGVIRVRFKPSHPSSGNTALHKIIDGDILPSVSRRDTRRDKVSVWTCGNRVFGCEDPGTLLASMLAVIEGRDPIAAANEAVGHRLSREQRNILRRSCTQLGRIIEQEDHEWREISARNGSDVVGRA